MRIPFATSPKKSQLYLNPKKYPRYTYESPVRKTLKLSANIDSQIISASQQHSANQFSQQISNSKSSIMSTSNMRTSQLSNQKSLQNSQTKNVNTVYQSSYITREPVNQITSSVQSSNISQINKQNCVHLEQTKKCPQGNTLNYRNSTFYNPIRFQCNICHVPIDDEGYRCNDCDYDLCIECFNYIGQQAPIYTSTYTQQLTSKNNPATQYEEVKPKYLSGTDIARTKDYDKTLQNKNYFAENVDSLASSQLKYSSNAYHHVTKKADINDLLAKKYQANPYQSTLLEQ